MAAKQLQDPQADLELDWPMRTLDSAEIRRTVLADGRHELAIRHAVLEGVTPCHAALVVLHTLTHPMPWKGRVVPRYRVWHPIDHISFRLLYPGDREEVGPGAVFHYC